MIVQPAIVEGDRTRWQVIAEPEDAEVPRSELWIEGALHPASPGIEAIWLTLALAPFARRRLVVPGAVSARLCSKLEALIGVSVVGAGFAPDNAAVTGSFSATMIGDPLDIFLGTLARTPTTFSIGSGVEVSGLEPRRSDLRVVSNGPTLRRCHWPLDRIGELAALMMIAPSLSICSITAFLCREECGGLAPDDLVHVAGELGMTLEMPLAQTGVHQLGKISRMLAIPAVSAFGSCWTRYRMFPKIIGRIYRDLRVGLDASGFDSAERRIAEYFEHTACHDGDDGDDALDGGVGRSFYCPA